MFVNYRGDTPMREYDETFQLKGHEPSSTIMIFVVLVSILLNLVHVYVRTTVVTFRYVP